MEDYINSEVCADGRVTRKMRNRETHRSGTQVYKWVVVSFCLLCILQISLNISLRLVAYQFCDECDQQEFFNVNLTTLNGDKELRTCYNTLIKHRDKLLTRYLNWVKTPQGCVEDHELADRYLALVRDLEVLLEKFDELQKEKTLVEEERDRLKSIVHIPPKLKLRPAPGTSDIGFDRTGRVRLPKASRKK